MPSLYCGLGEENAEGQSGEAVTAQPLARHRRCPGGWDEARSSPGYDLGPSASLGGLLQFPKRMLTARKERGEGPSSDDFPFIADLVLGSHFPQ